MNVKTVEELQKEVARLEAQVEVLKEIVRGPRKSETSVHPSMFTTKQHAVIQLLHEGKGTDEMAECLGTSAATLKGHIKSIAATLGVHKREEIIEKTKAMLESDDGEYLKHAGLSVSWARDGAQSLKILTNKTR